MTLHHVQIACPAGSEEALREYFGGLLGMVEIPKPPALAARGGAWFAFPADPGNAVLHIGVEADFRPARKAHPAFTWSDLDGLAGRLAGAGYEVVWADASETGNRRFHSFDCHGNRIEFVAAS
ncbi:hypothetical protein [Longispora albida]|uniref:hypothetical protein n=1 Tax=Longispora albida TaxID=203523 RepID=UPI0003828A71|nr:hypothetical protein [Longispora albida]